PTPDLFDSFENGKSPVAALREIYRNRNLIGKEKAHAFVRELWTLLDSYYSNQGDLMRAQAVSRASQEIFLKSQAR
ncbi:MAG: hypothetical protein KDB03_28875, partial [Planctomycetales bacterium]|nr:hypothetical protein [Planctomycetales bacterium]